MADSRLLAHVLLLTMHWFWSKENMFFGKIQSLKRLLIMDKTVHSVRSLGEGHGEKDGYPISQAMTGADGQFLPIRSDHLQYPSYVVSRSEGNKMDRMGRGRYFFSHPQVLEAILLKDKIHKTRGTLLVSLVSGNPKSYKKPTIPPPQLLFPCCHGNLWTTLHRPGCRTHSKTFFLPRLTSPDIAMT